MNRADLKTAALARADYLNSNFVTDAVMNVWVDQSFRELYDLVVLAHVDTYSSYFDDTVDANGVVSLASRNPDVYKVRAVDLDPTSSRPQPVRRFNFAERNRAQAFSYHDLGTSLKFAPMPYATGKKVRVYYVPQPTLLTDDTTPMDSTMTAYAEYMVAEMAAKVLEKAEDFEIADRVRARKNDIENKLRAMIPRDVGEPEQVADVTSGPAFWGDPRFYGPA